MNETYTPQKNSLGEINKSNTDPYLTPKAPQSDQLYGIEVQPIQETGSEINKGQSPLTKAELGLAKTSLSHEVFHIPVLVDDEADNIPVLVTSGAPTAPRPQVSVLPTDRRLVQKYRH